MIVCSTSYKLVIFLCISTVKFHYYWNKKKTVFFRSLSIVVNFNLKQDRPVPPLFYRRQNGKIEIIGGKVFQLLCLFLGPYSWSILNLVSDPDCVSAVKSETGLAYMLKNTSGEHLDLVIERRLPKYPWELTLFLK